MDPSLRGSLPTVARAGLVDLAGDIYITSLHQKQKKQRSQKSSTALDGGFLLRAMLESDSDVISILNSVKKIEAAASNKVYIENLVLEAANSRPERDCRELIEAIRKDQSLKLDIDINKVAEKLVREYKVDYDGKFSPDTLVAISENLKNLKAMDLPLPFSYIGNYLPAMLDLQNTSPLNNARQLRELIPSLNWSYVCNLVIGALLKGWTEENMTKAANFILHINVGHARPSNWKLSLATSYMKTQNVDLYINIIAGALHNLKNDDKDLKKEIDALFGSLYHIRYNSRNDELLLPLLEELVNTKIGIPPSQGSVIYSLCTSSMCKDLLETAMTDWENRDSYWTEQHEETFLEERRDMSRTKVIKENALKYVGKRHDKADSKDKVPVDLRKLISVQQELEKKSEVNGKIADNLIKAYAEQNEIDKALVVLSYCQKNREDFFMSPSVLDILVEKMIEEKRPTIDMVMNHMNGEIGRMIYISSLMNSLADLARQGQHEKVVSLLESFDPNLVLMERGANASSLLRVYSEMGDVEKVEEIFACIVTKGLGNTSHVINLLPLIDVHLVNGDPNSAVTEFLRICRLYKKMPRKSELSSRLILNEDIQGIQAVLDASIEIIGESKSLYDLTYSFLALGKKNQGRKLFETAGLNFDKNKMSFIFDQFKESGNVDACEDLVEISKVIFGCDRDFMYHRLVLVHKNNKEKVREISLKIAEENLVPSFILQKEIDQILSDGKSPTNEPEFLDDEVTRAIDCSDIEKALDIVMRSFQLGNTSLKCKKNFIDEMIYMNKIPEATTVARELANNFADPEKLKFLNLYYKLISKLHPSKKTAFLLSLNPAFRKRLRDDENSFVKKNSLWDSSKEDTELLEAFNSNNMSKALTLIASKKPSVKSVNWVLKKLLSDSRLEEADQVGQIVCEENFLDQFHYYTQANVHTLLRKYQDLKDLQKIEDFVAKLSPKANLLLRGDIWVKISKLKISPDKYLEQMLSHQDDPRKWMVNTEVLLEAVDLHPSIVSDLEELASKGILPATALLAKLSLAREDMDEFERLAVLLPESILSSMKSGLFDKIDTRDKMVTTMNCMKKLNMNKAVLRNIANCYLSINKKSPVFGELATTVIDEDGLKLSDLSKSLLVRLANNTQFKYQTEARKFMDLVHNE